jgi:mRNA interferase YafQ
MRQLILTGQFRRDTKLAKKRGKDMSKLRELIALLEIESPLPDKFRDHALSGEWKHHRDSHIEPDWLLIYKIDGNDLYLVRTGTHSDLF